jgi:hypothetical protein
MSRKEAQKAHKRGTGNFIEINSFVSFVLSCVLESDLVAFGG